MLFGFIGPALLLGFWANKAIAGLHEDSQEEVDSEAVSFVLASILTNYDVIIRYSFADFCAVLQVRRTSAD